MMVTGRSDPEDLKAALEAGANDYIVKSIDAELLDVRLIIAEAQGHIMIERLQDALISERPYKRPFTHEEAVALIVEGRGRTSTRKWWMPSFRFRRAFAKSLLSLPTPPTKL
jgi:response regulator RpfG family c-di-GMP phosphodiesterase